MNLNPEQEKAKNKIEGPLLIIAGAGSGKTATLTARIEHMIKSGISPNEILAVTFTNKAAREMKERVGKTLGVEYQASPYKNRGLPLVGTFHSIGVFILKEKIDTIGFGKDFVIYDESDKLSIIKGIIKDDLGLDEKKYPARSIASFISNAKNALITASKYERYVDSHIKEIVNKVYLTYEKRLEENNALDFDDILLKTLEILQIPENLENYQERYKYIMVDEYQDTNQVQYEIVKLLASKYRNLAVVGDDWQCLTPETKIETKDGTKEIKDIIIGDKVLSYDGENKGKYFEVKNIHSKKINEEIFEIKTNSGKTIKATKNHIFFSNPEEDNKNYEYAVYLMYKENYGYRIGFTRYKGRNNSGNILGIRKRLNGERADFAWILETTNDIKKAKYLEQLLSFKYSIPQTVFFAKGKLQELTQIDIEDIYRNIDTFKNVENLFRDFTLNKDYPHIIASSTNRFDSLRVNINFLMMGGSLKSRRFGMYRVTLHTSNESVINILQENFPELCRKSKLGIRIDKELADYDKIWLLTQDIYKTLKESGFNVLINERLSFLKQSYIFTPASNLRVGFGVNIFNENLLKYEKDFIVEINKIDYAGDIYDIDISRTHNFVANGILVHNSIYSWRGADMRNILNFEKDYPEALIIKLEQNYRSTQNIINAANIVIKNNKTSLEKTLFTENEIGEKIIYIDAPTDRIESSTIARIIKNKKIPPLNLPLAGETSSNPPPAREGLGEGYSQNLILYRTNGQSRALEEALMVEGIPYKVVGGLKFYDRMEVKDLLAYLRVIHNPNDSQGIKRIINVPSRKIGATTLQKLEDYKNNFGVSYLQIFENIEEVDDLNSGAKRAVYSFYEILLSLMESSKKLEVSELIDEIVEKIGYKEYLKDDATRDEYEARIDNINELKNVASTYNGMEPRESLSQFLEEVMLVTDMENKNNEGSDFVTLMTIHTSKGLEFERVFITGLEDGLFPSSRTFSEPKELEEERRLMYVAMTRAKKELYISKASERFQYGSYINNPPSRFLKEINPEFIENYVFETNSSFFSSNYGIPNHDEPVFKVKKTIVENDVSSFNIGDKLYHPKFGVGIIISMNGDLAEIKFPASGIKKMNIKIAPVKKI